MIKVINFVIGVIFNQKENCDFWRDEKEKLQNFLVEQKVQVDVIVVKIDLKVIKKDWMLS